MKVLSIQQPWAHAILHLGKTVENRTWATPYRGPLLIHAGSSRVRLGALASLGVQEPPADKLVFGAIIGVVDLVECIHFDDLNRGWRASTWTESGGYCWMLANPRPLAEPFKCKGRLGLFDPPTGFQLPG